MLFILIIISQIHQFNDLSSYEDKDNFMIDQNFQIKTSSNSQVISINGNYELNQTATSGNGTMSNPYIIEWLTINGNGSLYCILINNTNKFFIIRDCTLFNSTFGLYLNNVSNGDIFNNFIYSNFYAGLLIKGSNNNTILLNNVYNNRLYGCLMHNCNFTKLTGNQFRNNNFTGIFLNFSHFNDILVNEINYHQYALILQSSNYSSVISNHGIINNYGIKQIDCTGNVLEGNFFRKVSPTRYSDSKSEKHKKTIIDFTLILLVGISGLALCFFIQKKKKIISIFKQ